MVLSKHFRFSKVFLPILPFVCKLFKNICHKSLAVVLTVFSVIIFFFKFDLQILLPVIIKFNFWVWPLCSKWVEEVSVLDQISLCLIDRVCTCFYFLQTFFFWQNVHWCQHNFHYECQCFVPINFFSCHLHLNVLSCLPPVQLKIFMRPAHRPLG